jgi:hypothetical protein
MNKAEFERRLERIKEVNDVIEVLDPAVRHDAFLLLEEYIQGGSSDSDQMKGGVEIDTEAEGNADRLILGYASDKPYENVKLIAAYFYSLYGRAAIEIEKFRKAANNFGLTIPERPDMTLKQATKNKKKLFAVREGACTPTVHGEQFMRETYGVAKGTMTKPTEGG